VSARPTTATREGAAPVLSVDSVRLALTDGERVAADLRLQPGALALAFSDDPPASAPLIDALCGLAQPEAGTIRVLGHAWPTLAGDRANALRGRIGTIATDPVFPRHLGVGESTVMGPLFHSRRPEAEILATAARLARTFGLPGLPLGGPDDLGRDELIRAACVRALLGAPDLLIVDETPGALPPALDGALVNALRGVCARGGAVLWLTGEPARNAEPRFPATKRLELRDGRLAAPPETPAPARAAYAKSGTEFA
jgi:phospholipid/cholesterol/gamma-HCH transport system ATP-binding protein